MTKAIIKAENLGKHYLVGHKSGKADQYIALRDVISQRFKSIARNAVDVLRGRQVVEGDELEQFWALKQVSFEVQPGEVLGIIGHNGAGKSTLLKILSRITEPSAGRVSIGGRVASLLEVGTGFHPELSGRENIYLNGAILGMTRSEIKQKFDQIVAFADVERFLDTPVKRYSSGMYVRLAFSVAAHLDPEILVVDEVLAVGDARFQQKCMGKMRDVAQHGRTLLFVSHNLGSIRQLCRRSLLLNAGSVQMLGNTEDVIDAYLAVQNPQAAFERVEFPPDTTKPIQLLEAFASGPDGTPAKTFSCDDPIVIHMTVAMRRPIPGLFGYCEISRSDGTIVMVADSLDAGDNPLDGLDVGRHTAKMRIPGRVLGHGDYRVQMAFASRTDESRDDPGIIATFSLSDESTWRGHRRNGLLSVLTDWTCTPSEGFVTKKEAVQ